jgi:hypothetical protein
MTVENNRITRRAGGHGSVAGNPLVGRAWWWEVCRSWVDSLLPCRNLLLQLLKPVLHHHDLRQRGSLFAGLEHQGRILTATARSRRVSRARYTSPIPPAPIAERISKGPRRLPARIANVLPPNYIRRLYLEPAPKNWPRLTLPDAYTLANSCWLFLPDERMTRRKKPYSGNPVWQGYVVRKCSTACVFEQTNQRLSSKLVWIAPTPNTVQVVGDNTQ